jgi:hypothetical protein
MNMRLLYWNFDRMGLFLLQVSEALDQLLAREAAGIPDQVVPRQPAAVRHHIARRQLLGCDRVVHPESWEVFAHRLVPVEIPLVD